MRASYDSAVEAAWALTLFVLGSLLLTILFYEAQTKELLMALSEDLTAIAEQLTKAKDEIVGRITDLEGALASAGEQPQEVTDAVAALKEIAQGLDDVVKDVPAQDASA